MKVNISETREGVPADAQAFGANIYAPKQGQNLNNEKDALELAEEIMSATKDLFSGDGHVDPVTFVIANLNPTTGTAIEVPLLLEVASPFEFTERGKELYRDLVQGVCDKVMATGYLFVSEAWMVHFGKDEKDKFTQEWIGRFSEHPQKIERVIVAYEHRAFGHKMWAADIKRPENGKPYLENYVPLDVTGSSGKFVGLLPMVQ